MTKIAIIMSTTRETRFADKPAGWIYDAVGARDDLEAELVDLRDFPLPFFDEVASNLWVPTENEAGVRWQQKLAEFDGYIFVVAEYNWSIPAVLKNALDYAYNEWNKKPAAYVGYGSVGAARAIQELRLINVELQMVPLHKGVHIQGGDFFAVWQGGQSMDSLTHLQPGVEAMLDELAWWSGVLQTAREQEQVLAGTTA